MTAQRPAPDQRHPTQVRRKRRACVTCGRTVIHLNGRPYPAHLRSAVHRSVVVVAQREDGAPISDRPAAPPRARTR